MERATNKKEKDYAASPPLCYLYVRAYRRSLRQKLCCLSSTTAENVSRGGQIGVFNGGRATHSCLPQLEIKFSKGGYRARPCESISRGGPWNQPPLKMMFPGAADAITRPCKLFYRDGSKHEPPLKFISRQAEI